MNLLGCLVTRAFAFGGGRVIGQSTGSKMTDANILGLVRWRFIMANKVHYLRPGFYGLLEHLATYCWARGQYLRDAIITSYRTGAKYPYTNDLNKVTCKSCLLNLVDEGIIK